MDSPEIAPLPALVLVRCTSCPTEVARDWLLRDGWMLREGYWFCCACLPASQWVVELDRARNAHQVTILQLEQASDQLQRAIARIAVWETDDLDAARDRIADLEQRLLAMTSAAAQANRDATAALERERIALALDRAARAVTGKSAAEVNAELDLQVEAYPDEEIHDGSTIDLLDDLDRARAGCEHPDPFASRAWALRLAEIQREIAIRNRRETERQDALPPIDAEVDPCV